MKRLMHILSFVIWHLVPPVAALSTVPFLVFWWMDNDPPLTVTGYHLETPVVDRLGNIRIDYEATFHRRCTGAGRRTFVDSAHFRMPINPYYFRFGVAADGSPVPLDVKKTFPVEATVPDGAAPGPATYQNVTEFYCNPLQLFLRGTRFDRHITFRYPVIDFEITNQRATKITPPKTLFRPVYEFPDALEEMPSTTPPPPPDERDRR